MWADVYFHKLWKFRDYELEREQEIIKCDPLILEMIKTVLAQRSIKHF